jgi:ABC-type lipoprotein release transport system permease subunit
LALAWRNAWRNPRRTVLTAAAIAFACVLLVFMLSWQFGSYETMVRTSVSVSMGHVQVQAPGYKDRPEAHTVVEDPSRVAQALDGAPGVRAWSMRARAFSLLSAGSKTYGGMVVGIQPQREARVSRLEELVRQGEYLAPGDYGQALVGSVLAENLGIGPGDELVVLGQGRDGSIAAMAYTVKGVYRSGLDEFDRSTIHVPLASFQEAFAMRGAVHMAVAAAESLDAVPALKAHLETALEPDLAVWDWKELMPGLVQSIQMDLAGGIIFYAILLVIVAFSILNTFLMAVFERTREFGMLLALGARPGRIARMLLLESGTIALLGLAAGMVLGAAVTGYFQVRGIAIPGSDAILEQFGLPSRIHPRLSLLSLTAGPVAVLAITLLSALYPALKPLGLKPVEAMHDA